MQSRTNIKVVVPSLPAIEVCFVPMWRIGDVLACRDGGYLTVDQAKRMGNLFAGPTDGNFALLRYKTSRVKALHQSAKLEKATVDLKCSSVPDDLRRELAIASETSIHYLNVPVLGFPHYSVTFDDDGTQWIIREGLTVCADNSHSKQWLNLTLVSWKGESTLKKGIPCECLGEARTQIEGFRRRAASDFLSYYSEVLDQDTRHLDPPKPQGLTPLKIVAQTEILGLMVDADLTSIWGDGLRPTPASRSRQDGAEKGPRDQLRVTFGKLFYTNFDASHLGSHGEEPKEFLVRIPGDPDSFLTVPSPTLSNATSWTPDDEFAVAEEDKTSIFEQRTIAFSERMRIIQNPWNDLPWDPDDVKHPGPSPSNFLNRAVTSFLMTQFGRRF